MAWVIPERKSLIGTAITFEGELRLLDITATNGRDPTPPLNPSGVRSRVKRATRIRAAAEGASQASRKPG